MPLPRVTEMAHELVRRHLRPGDRALDATAGKGNDTLFLAHCVGASGRVDAFDIQPEAIAETRARVAGFPQVRLHQRGHESLAEFVEGPLAAAMFNLGYLPAGDKAIATRPDSTLAALEAARGLLAPGGILCVVAYPGHEGGAEEAAAVERWFAALDSSAHRAVVYRPLLGRPDSPSPFLLAAERR
jgi:ubiquinone/menaquinone biosynthesis C-methylase UbiE